MSLVSKTIGLLGGLYNLYQLGGTNGGIVVRQKGGTAGTNELKISNGGSYSVFTDVGAGLYYFQSANGGSNIVTVGHAPNSNSLGLGSTAQAIWTASTSDASADTGLARAAAGVVKTTDGSTGAGWIQNTAGTARVTANVTNATTTFSNITDLSVTLIAGRKYVGQMVLSCDDTVDTDGIKIDFNGGSATATSFLASPYAAIGGNAMGVVTSLSSASQNGFISTSANGCLIIVQISIVCNAGGTFIPRFAKFAHTTGTATVRANSYLTLQDSPN